MPGHTAGDLSTAGCPTTARGVQTEHGAQKHPVSCRWLSSWWVRESEPQGTAGERSPYCLSRAPQGPCLRWSGLWSRAPTQASPAPAGLFLGAVCDVTATRERYAGGPRTSPRPLSQGQGPTAKACGWTLRFQEEHLFEIENRSFQTSFVSGSLDAQLAGHGATPGGTCLLPSCPPGLEHWREEVDAALPRALP